MKPHLVFTVITLMTVVSATYTRNCQADNKPLWFQVEHKSFLFLKDPEHFELLGCYPDDTNIVFFDPLHKFTDHVDEWIAKYQNWKYIDEESRFYDWFLYHLNTT